MREVGEVLFELNSQNGSRVKSGTEIVKSFSAIFLVAHIR